MNAAPSTGEFHDGVRHLALFMFDHIPPGHLAFTVSDHSCEPLIRPGEVAIIDTADHEPEDGALFLRKAGSVKSRNLSLSIVETILREANIVVDGEACPQPVWTLANHHRPRSQAEIVSWLRAGKPGCFVDGPFCHYGENAWYVRDLLIGKVVGILSDARAATAIVCPPEPLAALEDGKGPLAPKARATDFLRLLNGPPRPSQGSLVADDSFSQRR